MSNLFIFTAGNQSAREHLENSILNPIDKNTVINSFSEAQRGELENIYDEEGGFFAWGAISGPVNERNWKAMKVGDWVLSVYDGFYHHAMQVKGKYENEELAKKVWGTNENDETWKFMYFLKRPQIPNIGPVPLIQLQSYLNRRYQGFWKISDEKIDGIENEFGSIEKFIEQMVLGVKFQGKRHNSPVQPIQ